MNKREVGSSYERIAGEYLKTLGYEIVEYNFHCRAGEIDIVAKEGEYLVFCEVKYRYNEEKGNPFEAVTNSKQRKISKASLYYRSLKHKEEMPCRFDVVGILKNEIRVVKNAFDYIG